MNKAIIIGNLGTDPELKNLDGGNAVVNFSLATTDKWTDKSGKAQEKTEWHRIVFYGKQAENLAKFLRKGSKCCVEGKIQTRSWEDKDGAKKYSTEIIGSNCVFLDSKNSGGDKFEQQEEDFF